MLFSYILPYSNPNLLGVGLKKNSVWHIPLLFIFLVIYSQKDGRSQTHFWKIRNCDFFDTAGVHKHIYINHGIVFEFPQNLLNIIVLCPKHGCHIK